MPFGPCNGYYLMNYVGDVKMKSYIKEKIIYCGDRFLEIDFINAYDKKKRGRAKKEYVTSPKNKRLNDKRARRYFIQLVNTNFDDNDLHIVLTYSNDNMPNSIEEAERIVKNYIRRISNKRKKKGLEKIKYIIVTEFKEVGKGISKIRLHHHIIMNKGLSRDEVEQLWRLPKRKGEKEGRKIGRANADRLQADEYGLEAIARYLSKDPAGKKRWIPSRNLDKPVMKEKDSRFTERVLENLAKCPDEKDFWEKRYPGYFFTECRPEWNEVIGKWSIYVKMRRYKRE